MLIYDNSLLGSELTPTRNRGETTKKKNGGCLNKHTHHKTSIQNRRYMDIYPEKEKEEHQSLKLDDGNDNISRKGVNYIKRTADTNFPSIV